MFLLGYISTKNADSKLYKPINSYCSRLAQTVTDFADASHSESAKSTTTTVLYGIFSSENSYPCTVTNKVPFYGNLPIKREKAAFQAAFPHFIWSIFDFYVLRTP